MEKKINNDELKYYLSAMKAAQQLPCGEDIEVEEKRILKEVLQYLDSCGIGDGILSEIIKATEFQF